MNNLDVQELSYQLFKIFIAEFNTDDQVKKLKTIKINRLNKYNKEREDLKRFLL